jgi:heat-inducible transcriptional repressor
LALLTERQLEIVLAVVYEYITTGEPIGSRTISRRYLKGCSSATVRNEMADLEEMGYLFQPHASAGRIPAPGAYRLYVESILQRRRTPPEGLKKWLREMNEKRQDLETIMSTSSRLLGQVTSYVGIAAVANLEDVVLQRVEFLRLGGNAVLMVVVLKGGLVHSKTVMIPEEISQDVLDDLARTINDLASGQLWSTVRNNLFSYLTMELEKIFNNCRDAVSEMDSLLTSQNYRLYTGGTSHILGLPDFQDVGKLRAVMSLLEEETSLAELVEKCSAPEGTMVTIGDENPEGGIKNCSLVTVSRVKSGQKAVLGLIGPIRMDYERSIALLETMLKGIYK